MSDLSKLVFALSSADLPEQQIVDALRVLGFRASTVGLRRVLEFSSKLRPQFQQLEIIFPEAKKILQDFQKSSEVLTSLKFFEKNQIDEFVTSEKESFGFCSKISGKHFKLANIEKFPLLAEIIAYLWLSQASLQAAPAIQISIKTSKYLRDCVDYIARSFPKEEFHSILSQSHLPSCGDINKWVNYSLPILHMMSSSGISDNEIKEVFLQCNQGIKQLESILSGQISESIAKLESSTVTVQRGTKLSERELLNVHHNAFKDSELQLISDDICKILDISSNDFFWKHCDIKPAEYYEALIIALALATCRTIHGALQLPIIRGDDYGYYSDEPGTPSEYIYLQMMQRFKGKTYFSPKLMRMFSTQNTFENIFKLPLPSLLRCLSSRTVYYNSSSKFLDCLPYTIVPWEKRCHLWLEKRLTGSEGDIDRRIRDALVREMYRNTANPALNTWIATPLKGISRKAESISNYLDPSGKRSIKSYRDACKQIFGDKHGNIIDIPTGTPDKGWPFKFNEIGAFSKCFINEITQAEIEKKFPRYHNAISNYLLMLLVVVTGHRKSYTPFYFAWDILLDECLVYVSDKQTVGSEARLVPIPKWISEQIKAYRNYLINLHHEIEGDYPDLAATLELILPRADHNQSDRISYNGKNVDPNQPTMGFFFTLDEDYKPHPISTRNLEVIYSKITNKGIRNFRKCIAEWLWNKGLSGHQIEAFLGHNGNMHAFGESSCWSIMEWAKPIREAQEGYLAAHGWVPIEIVSKSRKNLLDSQLLPAFIKSKASYEGRGLSNNSARARARTIIRDLLPPEWFDTETAQITDKDIQSLKEAAQSILATDQEACNKINQMLAKEITRIRKVQGRNISTTITNMTRTETGPIDISFSRHYAISCCIRKWWIDRLGNYSESPETNYIDRAASIGISFIIFDAVLDMQTWTSLLKSVLEHHTLTNSGCLMVRTEIVRQARSYDKSLLVSPLTSAEIVGFEKLHGITKFDEQCLKKINQRINNWLKSAPHNNSNLKLESLTTLFKAWWLPRLPGSLFAIATGNYSGPSPDQQSECALFGVPCTDLKSSSVAEDFKMLLNLPNGESKFAIKLINHLLNSARGRFELKQQTSKTQRKLLTRLLLNTDEHCDLKSLANQVPIVLIMIGFLQYLIEEGGKKVDVYRFNSIATYFSNINDLVELFWDRDISDLESEEYDSVYKEIIDKSPQSKTAIDLFHKYLRRTFNAPYSNVAMPSEHSPTQCRSSLVTTSEFKKALDSIDKIKDDGQLVRHTKTFMCIGQQYGFRTKEALGMSRKHFLTQNPYSILAEKNNVRDLKTRGKASLRIASPLLASKKYQDYLQSMLSLNSYSQTQDESIFADTGKKDQIYPISRIIQATTSALRNATGNLSVVPYSMRHTVATRLAHFYVRPPRQIPISKHADAALMSDIKPDIMTACFKQGFSAWPFWLDRVGMLLGHTSVDTLLNTYWHSSHIRLAEHTWSAIEDIHELKPQQLAYMLLKDRSVIHRKLSEIEEVKVNGITTALEATIFFYVSKSGIPGIDSDFETQKSITLPINQGENSQDVGKLNSWPAYDRLLRARLAHGLSIDEMKSLGEQFNLPKKQLSFFVDAYKSIVRESKFTDFEPSNSELLNQPPKRNSGIRRGSAERERKLTVAQELHIKSANFAEKFKLFYQLWIERVSTSTPWFVARTSEEVSLILFILLELGVNRSQLEYSCCNFNLSILKKILSETELASAKVMTKGLSRSGEVFRESEFGVRVGQKLDSEIGDNRDTHRLILVLAAIVLGLSVKDF